MRRATKLLGGAAAAMMAVTVMMAGGPRAGATPLTVADFAAVLTSHDNTGTRESPDQAVRKLLRLGVPLGDPEATLTEGRLASIMGFYGIQATTSNPAAAVEAERGGAVASILRATAPALAWSEKRRGSAPTGDLDVCLSEGNRGKCVNCCKDLGSPANACAHFCQDIEPASPSAPR